MFGNPRSRLFSDPKYTFPSFSGLPSFLDGTATTAAFFLPPPLFLGGWIWEGGGWDKKNRPLRSPRRAPKGTLGGCSSSKSQQRRRRQALTQGYDRESLPSSSLVSTSQGGSIQYTVHTSLSPQREERGGEGK